MQFKEEMQLLSGAPNAVGEEECVPLEPFHGLGGIFETDAGTAHLEVNENGYDVGMECKTKCQRM